MGVGAFSENGPFHPTGDELVSNDYSWNKGHVPFPLYFSNLTSFLAC